MLAGDPVTTVLMQDQPGYRAGGVAREGYPGIAAAENEDVA
jgi:hypothetical protein